MKLRNQLAVGQEAAESDCARAIRTSLAAVGIKPNAANIARRVCGLSRAREICPFHPLVVYMIADSNTVGTPVGK
jgi:hypothetical protein